MALSTRKCDWNRKNKYNDRLMNRSLIKNRLLFYKEKIENLYFFNMIKKVKLFQTNRESNK